MVRGLLPLLLVTAVGVVLLAVPVAAPAYHLSPTAEGSVFCYESYSTRVGGSAQIEVRSGSISSGDAYDGYLISQHLKVNGGGTNYMIRVGVMRNVVGTNFYWLCRNSSGDHLHYVTNSSPQDHLGSQVTARTYRPSSGSNWVVRIAGNWANDASGDHTATPGFSNINNATIGLVTNASSGHYGTWANPADNDTIRCSSDWGSSWIAWTSGGSPTETDPMGITGADWNTFNTSSWDVRNN